MKEIFEALNLNPSYSVDGVEQYPSCFQVSTLATSSFAAIGCSIAELLEDLNLDSELVDVKVNQRLASHWFNLSIQPIDWEMPPVWDAIAGLYQTRDGCIRLHTNLPHHRQAALSVLGVEAVKEKVATAVLTFDGNELETSIIQAGGVSAFMRSREDWQQHPQGIAVTAEPLVSWRENRTGTVRQWPATLDKPLNGLRVLDLTRVLAGPVATRTLAGFGAEVLRIDPPGWDEANIVPDIALGKRCAFLDLKTSQGLDQFKELLASADVLVHGYRSDALEQLGLSEQQRQAIAPNLLEVSLDAYGWTGPWATRRGFDSLVQMSSGIAHAGMLWAKADVPTPLPVQALDFATGYLMAASLIRALSRSIKGEGIQNARLSLARTSELLQSYSQSEVGLLEKTFESRDFASHVEETPWGQANRLKPAVSIGQTTLQWDLPACELGSSDAAWTSG